MSAADNSVGAAAATARSGDVGTQTEPPKVDAGIQAELADLQAPAAQESPAVMPPSSRPVTTTNSRRPSTQSRSKPATAASSGASNQQQAQQRLQLQQKPATQRSTPPTAREPVSQPGILFVDNDRAWRQFQESSPQQRQHGSECTPMVYSYNPDPRLRAWQSLEHARLHQMGLSSKLSRRYNVQRSRQFVPVGLHMRGQPTQLRAAFLPPLTEEFSDSARKKNDVAPFLTFQKPTCGYFFSRETDNRKIKHGLAPADLPSWGVDLQQ